MLQTLLAKIESDRAGRKAKTTYLIFLGDLIDRGPDSKGVLELLESGLPADMKPVFLLGNHEEILLRVLDGEEEVMWNWLKFGGTECLASYGLDPAGLNHVDGAEALRRIRAAIPPAHRQFLQTFADTFRFGDYLFVHAGIRPGLAIEDQQRQDLRWIREPFLGDRSDHGRFIVHGHTIATEVEEFGCRIGIDTGAYRTGVLTAIGVEDEERWYLSTRNLE